MTVTSPFDSLQLPHGFGGAVQMHAQLAFAVQAAGYGLQANWVGAAPPSGNGIPEVKPSQ